MGLFLIMPQYNTFYGGDLSLERLTIDDTPISPFDTESHSFDTIHGEYPPPVVCEPTTIQYYGRRIELACPILSVAAILVHFSRKHIFPVNPPLDAPQDLAPGYVGPRLEDYADLNVTPHARLPPATAWDWQASLSEEVRRDPRAVEDEAPSAKLDIDWQRLVYNVHLPNDIDQFAYDFGSMNGLWVGKMIVSVDLVLFKLPPTTFDITQLPDEGHYFELIPQAELPNGFSEYYPLLAVRFVYMRLREYHCISPKPAMYAGDIRNAWCPWFNKFHEERACSHSLYMSFIHI